MSTERDKLQEILCSYTTETLVHINTVKGFTEGISDWTDRRTAEVSKMKDFKTSNHKPEKQQKELEAVLMDTLVGLEKLDLFLDAVEKLAVTSLHVYIEGNQVLHLPEEVSLEHVQAVIIAARQICPLLLEFKRDAQAFFLPKVLNVEVLAYQLDRYIQTTARICEDLKISHLPLGPSPNIVVNLDETFSEDDIQRMLLHINHLTDIRMDSDFRLVFLFQEVSCTGFIKEFTKLLPKMLQFLEDQEKIADLLNSVNKDGKITSVAGNSLGVIGDILTIIGLALAPVTAGVSLGLTFGGIGCGIASGVIGITKVGTEIGVNHVQLKKANRLLQTFMEDVQHLHDCLSEVTTQAVQIEVSQTEVAMGVGKIAGRLCTIGNGIDSLFDTASAVEVLKSQKVIESAGRVAAQESQVLRNVPRVVADIPDIGQATLRGPLALSKMARAGLIGANVFFLGLDVFFICKDSVSLAKGSEAKLSQSIRARAALWRSEINAWEKIHDSLCEGLLTSEANMAVLFKPFYPIAGLADFSA
ncbi:uncharacterized protein LOC117831856 [Notolabrus celidotus]|uniref:uncharacterized protein LOC117831856 n=1 Tax=Notolabrus celidotus TaxID=1203425 RepID=UPI00148FDE41|nr:uncharacterized protein LOC117831856 [Notolabrus celidotus]